MNPAPQSQLIVFSDDWGRHPSSCQHLVRRLLPRHQVLWVNTIGTRLPTLSVADTRRAMQKIGRWLRPGDEAGPALPANLRVIGPKMYPGFRTRWQRGFNAKVLCNAIHRALGPRKPAQRRVCLTTLPITADLVGKLEVDRWVYYCVDDFTVWPGMDAGVMTRMERQLVAKADALVAVSESLRTRLSDIGRPSELLTHGIDLAHWSAQTRESAQAQPKPAGTSPDPAADCFAGLPRPIYAFWGLVDCRLDTAWCQALASSGSGTVAIIGPSQSPDPRIAATERVKMLGPIPYERLPRAAAAADVLIMPYADLPVTRAMQPLKFKEYLATGKPVVARALPGIVEWGDAADLVTEQQAFVAAALRRAKAGIDPAQRAARQRLAAESWENKAAALERVIEADGRG